MRSFVSLFVIFVAAITVRAETGGIASLLFNTSSLSLTNTTDDEYENRNDKREVLPYVVPVSEKDKQEAFHFLEAYGYLAADEGSLTFDNATAMRNALSLFQEYYRLRSTGVLNADTLRFMRLPRCGVKDIINHGFNALARRWPKKHLTWNFQLADEATLIVTQAAFKIWSANSALSFARDLLYPDILISYKSGMHVYANRKNGFICPSRFDGSSNVLAHAFFPSGRDDDVSEVHINDAEKWHIYLTSNPWNKFHLLHTLTHEIGHALGLSHSMNNNSIMFPYTASGPQYPVVLDVEDIVAIQNLYGAHDGEVTSPAPPPPSTSSPLTTTMEPPIPTTTLPTTTTSTTKEPANDPLYIDLCSMRRFDAILILNRRMYLAHRTYVWSVNLLEKMYSKPLRLVDYIKSLPPDFKRLSAVYQRPSGDIVLFAKRLVYVMDYPSFELRSTWPRNFTDIRLPSTAKINAVLNTNTGRTYVIYDEDKVAEFDECYNVITKHFSLDEVFPGIPIGIKFAFRHTDGNLYFATHRQIYVFNEFTSTVVSAAPFDLHAIGIECPKDGLLRQLRGLLDRLYRSAGNTISSDILKYTDLYTDRIDNGDEDIDDDGDND